MSDQTGISWCDSTFNPWIGCTKVSPACDHCYAERDMATRLKVVQWGAGQARKRTSASNWKLPERWNRDCFVLCSACGWRGVSNDESGCPDCGPGAACDEARRRVFSASLADWLDSEVPIEWLVDFLDLVRRTPNLDWLLLSKRIGNWRSRIAQARVHLQERVTGSLMIGLGAMALVEWLDRWIAGTPPANVWLGATVVNQDEANRDIPKLLRVPASVRFMSIEPMLGPIDLNPAAYKPCPNSDDIVMDPETGAYDCCSKCDHTGISDEMAVDWIICGGESGPHARPMHRDWVRSLRDQCQAAGVAFFMKQTGVGLGEEWGCTHRAGADPAEWPAEFRHQEFPNATR